VIAANKIDLPHGPHLAALSAICVTRGIHLFPLSAVTGEGIDHLVEYLAATLNTVHGSQLTVHGSEAADPKPKSSEPSTVNRYRSTL
jgi:hypothetical protein